jgi:hypothetical protein
MQMAWIEAVFGMSPDNGDGSTEAMIVTASCVIAFLVLGALIPKTREHARRLLANATARFR